MHDLATSGQAAPARVRAAVSKAEIVLAVMLGMAYPVLWAMDAGKGVTWDEKNYHSYNVYAWLSGTMDYHLAPAGQHSWLNPILYVPHYWVIHHVPPAVAGGIFAAWAGLNFVLIYVLAVLVLVNSSRWLAGGIAVVCGIVGLSDPLFLTQIGTSDADDLVSLPVLGSLCSLAWASREGRSAKSRDIAYGTAGVLLGAAAGLKWTCFVYAVGMTVSLLLLWKVLNMNPRRFLWFAVGGIAGYLPAGGYWNWVLWTGYQNPFFPYWNRYFRSPWAIPANYRDLRFPPDSLQTALTFPFQWFVGLHPTNEAVFRTAVFAFLSVLIPAVALVLLGRWVARRARRMGVSGSRHATMPSETFAALLAGREPWWLLLTFAVISYAVWIRLFAIQRYLVPIALLAGLLLWLCCDFLFSNRAAKLAVFLFLAAFSVHWMQRESSGWRVAYGYSWFGLQLPAEVQQPETLFVMLGSEPMGYIVPYLPESTRTVRLTEAIMPGDGTPTELTRRAQGILSQHAGAMRSLSVGPLQEADFNYLKRFGLVLVEAECKQFRSDVDQFTTCPVLRPSAAETRTQEN